MRQRGPLPECNCRPCRERRKKQREYIARIKDTDKYKERVRVNNERQNSKRRIQVKDEGGNEAWKQLMR